MARRGAAACGEPPAQAERRRGEPRRGTANDGEAGSGGETGRGRRRRRRGGGEPPAQQRAGRGRSVAASGALGSAACRDSAAAFTPADWPPPLESHGLQSSLAVERAQH